MERVSPVIAKAEVISNEEVMPSTHLIWLEVPDIAICARPGQFVMAGTNDIRILPRPLSIHQRNGGKIALLVRVIGKGTGWLSGRNKDENLQIIGPLGNGFTVNTSTKNLLLVSGGIGIAPLMFLAQEGTKEGRSVILIKGAITKTELYPDNLIPKEIKVATASDDGTAGKIGVVTALLPEYADFLSSSYIDWADQVFACGPLAMYKDMARRRETLLKDKPCQVSLEMRMACGHGVCYGCTIETRLGLKQVCKDGPVFELDDIKDTLTDDAACLKWLTV